MYGKKGVSWILKFMVGIIPLILACSLLDRFPGFSDGCYIGWAKAWIDENENGIWDKNEKPLMGVLFVIEDSQQESNLNAESTSDEKGEAFLRVFPNTCRSLEEADLVIKATPPLGYRVTTPIQVSIPREKLLDPALQEFLFGFAIQTSR